jgi:hypothetical protein
MPPPQYSPSGYYFLDRDTTLLQIVGLPSEVSMGRILGPDELRNCEVVGSQIFTDSRQLLGAVFCTSALGFAIFDRQIRFQAINGSLASINGVPAKAHLGKTPFQIFGNAAEMGELKIQHVLATGQRLLNYYSEH